MRVVGWLRMRHLLLAVPLAAGALALGCGDDEPSEVVYLALGDSVVTGSGASDPASTAYVARFGRHLGEVLQRGVAAPLRRLLIRICDSADGGLIEMTAPDHETDGEPARREAAGKADRRDPSKVVRHRQSGQLGTGGVGLDGRCSDGGRGRDEDVKRAVSGDFTPIAAGLRLAVAARSCWVEGRCRKR